MKATKIASVGYYVSALLAVLCVTYGDWQDAIGSVVVMAVFLWLSLEPRPRHERP